MIDPNSNVFNTSAALYNTSADKLLGNSAQGFLGSMNSFANPYQTAVLNNVDQRSREDEALAMNQIQTNAANAGAFGGSRHGLVEAETMRNFADQRARMGSELLYNGFGQQAQLAQTAAGVDSNNISQMLQASGQGFDTGNTANAGMAQAGAQQQGLLQSILNMANGQVDAFNNYPNSSLGTAMAGLSGNPLNAAGTQTSQFNPGLFNYMQLGGGLLSAGK